MSVVVKCNIRFSESKMHFNPGLKPVKSALPDLGAIFCTQRVPGTRPSDRHILHSAGTGNAPSVILRSGATKNLAGRLRFFASLRMTKSQNDKRTRNDKGGRNNKIGQNDKKVLSLPRYNKNRHES